MFIYLVPFEIVVNSNVEHFDKNISIYSRLRWRYGHNKNECTFCAVTQFCLISSALCAVASHLSIIILIIIIILGRAASTRCQCQSINNI